MQLPEILQEFLSRSSDAVCIGYRASNSEAVEFIYVNPEFATLFGYQIDNIEGCPFKTCFDFDGANTLHSKLANPDLEREDQFEIACKRRDGSRFWANASMFPIKEHQTNGQAWCITLRDLTDLKARDETTAKIIAEQDRMLAKQEKMDRELAAAQTRLSSAMNGYPDPFVIYDKDMRLVICNTAYQVSMSTNPQAICPGIHIRDVLAEAMACGRMDVPPADRETVLATMTDPKSMAKSPENFELAGDIHHRMHKSRAENGDWVIIRLDITELVRQKRSAEKAEARLLAAIRAYPAPFCICDANGQVVVWNESYSKSLTDNPSELVQGMPFKDTLRVGIRNNRFIDVAGREDQWLDDMTQSTRNAKPIEDISLADDTHHRILRSRSTDGDMVILTLETTHLVRQKRALEATQHRLMSAINAFPESFSIYGPNLHLLMWNSAFVNSITDEPNEIQAGMHVSDVFSIAVRNGRVPAAKGRETEWCDENVTPDILNVSEEEFESDNDTHYRIVRSRAENGELVVLRLNITEAIRQRRTLEHYAKQLEAANQEITHKALHDELTGLGNRRFLAENFEELSKRRKEIGGELASLHIDLDRFKQINDTIGHAAGDHVLMDVANRIRANVRSDDIVARIGGDEFVILLWLPQASDRPEKLAHALLNDLRKPSNVDGRECRFGASIGIAQTPLADETNLLTNSDIALYKAKRAGRGQMATFDRNDIEEMRNTKAMADDIIRALEAKEFLPYYQPQIDAKTGEVVGIEALARWQHPSEGVREPGAFLPVATDLNVVADIDRMIFEKAIEECQHHLSGMDVVPSLSFNVSAKRIQYEEIEQIGKIANAYSGEVAFELLETIFLEEESDAFLLQLDQLRELGITLEVDDFGSGRASVIALQRIAPDRLKIDRRLVMPIAAGNSAIRLVRSIVEIGHALDIAITAEGVETEEHVRILASLGVERLQGYFFAKPMNLQDLLVYLRDNTAKRHLNRASP